MRRFRERNLAVVGAVSVALTLALIAAALNFSKLPLINNQSTHSADFANAAGLADGDSVTVHGVDVGTITGMHLEGNYVKVTFSLDNNVKLGSASTASAEILSPIGTEDLAISSTGPGPLVGAIPLSRTTIPYTLVGALSQLGTQIQQYNTGEIAKAFEASAADLSGTSAQETTAAFDGLARVSTILAGEQSSLANIVSQGDALAKTLSQRSGQLFNLVGQGALVLQVVQQRQAAVKSLLNATSALSQQITSILSTNSSQLDSLLGSLQTVSLVLAQDSNDLGGALPVLAAFSKYAANSTGSGAFADVSIPTLLLPDNLIDQCSAANAFPSRNPQVGCRP